MHKTIFDITEIFENDSEPSREKAVQSLVTDYLKSKLEAMSAPEPSRSAKEQQA